MNYGLLGQKLAHSYSPLIHQQLGDYPYELFEVEPDQLSDFLAQPFEGLNVTIPYKQSVMSYCHQLSEAAKAIGSVNTLIRQHDGTLYGDNTDVAGFWQMLVTANICVAGKKVLVLGSGGSSLTVCHVLKREGADQVIVVSRRGPTTYDNLNKYLDSQVIVNTTPVGMYPNNGQSPLSLQRFGQLEAVVDLIYNPNKTALLLEADQLSIPAVGGLGMLVGQAVAASTLFTGKTDFNVREFVSTIQKTTLNLVLVGMPGSGKTTIATALGMLTGREVIDTDAEIIKKAKKSIPDIFEASGEAHFRELESAVIADVGKNSGKIISTGGGCVTTLGNFDLLRQNGIVVFLTRNVAELSRQDRPLSTGDLDTLYQQRLPLYEAIADKQVSNTGLVEDVAKKVWEAFNEAVDY